VDFDGDDVLAGPSDDRVDDSPDRPLDGHLDESLPRWMRLPQERLDHRRLEAVPNARTRARKQPDADIGAEHAGESGKDREARLRNPAFDFGEMTRRDVRSAGKSAQGEARIEARSLQFRTQGSPQLAGHPAGLSPQVTSIERSAHALIKHARPSLARIP
jgi:hypothetical protein